MTNEHVLHLKATAELRRALENTGLAYDDEGDVIHIVTDTPRETLATLAAIVDLEEAMPDSEYCAYCRRSVDRYSEYLEHFTDGTLLHRHCADELRAEGDLPPEKE